VSQRSQPSGNGHRASIGTDETIFQGYETSLKHRRTYVGVACFRADSEGVSMFEFVIAVIALSSVSIFFAHVVEAYLTQ
jgi:hypothetical protein